MQLSALFAKQVVSPSGDDLGCVLGVFLSKNQKSVARLVCVDGDDEPFYLPARAIREIGDVIVADDVKDANESGVPCPLGRTVFSDTGKKLGYLKDVILADEGVIVVDGGEELHIPLSRVKLGDAVIVRSERATTARQSGGSMSERAARQPRKKRTLPDDGFPEQQNFDDGKNDGGMSERPLSRTAKNAATNQSVPNGVNRINLLGRRVKTDLLDSDGEILAARGEIITPQILQRARRSNRLLMLTVCTLTNIVL